MLLVPALTGAADAGFCPLRYLLTFRPHVMRPSLRHGSSPRPAFSCPLPSTPKQGRPGGGAQREAGAAGAAAGGRADGAAGGSRSLQPWGCTLRPRRGAVPALPSPSHPQLNAAICPLQLPQGQLEASRRDLQAAEGRVAAAAQGGPANPQLAQYLSVTLQQLQLMTQQKEASEADREQLAAGHARLSQALERERRDAARQAAQAQQQVGGGAGREGFERWHPLCLWHAHGLRCAGSSLLLQTRMHACLLDASCLPRPPAA